MRSLAPELQHWMVQPLVEAGLALEEIRVLVFRLGFETIVDAERGEPGDLMALVDDQPVEVRAAWAEMIDRMIALDSAASERPRASHHAQAT